jgi:hypothetical protein
MNNKLHETLEPIKDCLMSINRNFEMGWYELEIGIPIGWVFGENESIKCEIVEETDKGKIICISPKNNDVYLDDLIFFVIAIIGTNKKIAEKEKEFTTKMNEMKSLLELEAEKFYKELEDLKEKSFNDLNENSSQKNDVETKSKNKRIKKSENSSTLNNDNIQN